MSAGPLCLVGGDEWSDGCSFDEALLAESQADQVVVLPTAAAFESPGALVDRARTWFDSLGAPVRALPVMGRTDALDAANVEALRGARFIYLSSGSPMHLRSVLLGTGVLDAVAEAWRAGAVLAASAGSAAALFEHMVDTRGGALTVGLGLVAGFAMIPRFETWSPETVRRTVALTPPHLPVVGVDSRTALVHRSASGWSAQGAGSVHVFLAGKPAEISLLPPPAA